MSNLQYRANCAKAACAEYVISNTKRDVKAWAKKHETETGHAVNVVAEPKGATK